MHRTIHVEGRTPGNPGMATIVTVIDGTARTQPFTGSHHEAVYLAAISAMADALMAGVTDVDMTSPSEHLVGQMRATWGVGPELEDLNRALTLVAARFFSVSWSIAPRTP